ncbi:MAG: CaiB/BaiF CoA transferase family protein [Dongiaceae bacterium]
MATDGPLTGVTIVDLTRVLAGPYCTMVLGDLGARVIKIEAPGTGDDSRGYGPFVNGKSAYFIAMNRGKESIALDLKAPADRAIFERLLERADVLVENFRPGAMERLGYGWDSLREKHPRLIYAAASGFGQTGPYRSRPAYDMVVQGMGGIMSITGQPDGPPTRVGASIGDITAGLFTAIGIASALHRRNVGGLGMKIDVAMLDCQIAILENAISRYFLSGVSPKPLGARHPSIAPFAAFATGDGHMIIAAGTDALFGKLSQVIGQAQLASDPRFLTNDLRAGNVDELTRLLETTLRARPTAEWLEVLAAVGVPCGPINDMAAIAADPQVLARNMIVELADPSVQPLKLAGNPIKLSAYADPLDRAAAPELDGDRERILRELDGDQPRH